MPIFEWIVDNKDLEFACRIGHHGTSTQSNLSSSGGMNFEAIAPFIVAGAAVGQVVDSICLPQSFPTIWLMTTY